MLAAKTAYGASIDVGQPIVAASSISLYDSYSPSQSAVQLELKSSETPATLGFKLIQPKLKIMGPTTTKIFLPGDSNPRGAGQCVNFVRYAAKVSYSGNAEDWGVHINSKVPKVGSIVVMDVGKWGHVGIVVAHDFETVTIRSRNWRGLWIVSDDIFALNDVRISGYIDESLILRIDI